MASFVESPFLHARQMLSLNSSSSNPLTETRTSNINMEQLIMPVHPISQNQINNNNNNKNIKQQQNRKDN